MAPPRFPLIMAIIGALVTLAAACGGGPRPDSDSQAAVTVTPSLEASPSPLAPPEVASPPAEETPATATPARPPARVSLDYLDAEVLVPALPQQLPPPQPDADLESLIVQAVGEDLPSYSVYVRHLGDGRTAIINGDSVFYAASVYKVALLYEAYRQADAGLLDLGQELVLEEKYAEYDLGTLEELGLQVGDIMEVSDALRAMIIVSDTPSAVMLGDLLGWGQVEATLRGLGVARMSVIDRALPLAAGDMGRLLEAIASGQGLTLKSREAVLSLLLQEAVNDRIPALLPAGTPVAHKTGNWVNATHDAGIVWSPAGPYVIVILSDKPWEPEPLAQLSRLVYDYFNQSQVEE